MVSVRDIALVGGLGVLVFLVTRAGRDLFGVLKDIELPSIGDITFPEITFPEIKFPSLFPEANADSIRDDSFQGFDPNEPRIISPCKCGGIIEQINGKFVQKCLPCQLEDLPPSTLDPNRPLDLTDFAQKAASMTKAASPKVMIDAKESGVTSEIEGQQFGGGGPSFIGGNVAQTPIENLTLNQIIERFGVTASQAADIRARARDDFGDFDFGTNTGSGIGSVSKEGELASILPQPSGNVSDPRFEGLSLAEIAQRLTGGNISNF